jgi:hypothetical protein
MATFILTAARTSNTSRKMFVKLRLELMKANSRTVIIGLTNRNVKGHTWNDVCDCINRNSYRSKIHIPGFTCMPHIQDARKVRNQSFLIFRRFNGAGFPYSTMGEKMVLNRQSVT